MKKKCGVGWENISKSNLLDQQTHILTSRASIEANEYRKYNIGTLEKQPYLIY